ncbi:MAG: NAD-dependent succinate-semialdehyde dehydrogenase [Rhizobiaceae bacterium]
MQLNDHSLLTEKCYVAGRWIGVPADTVRNPATLKPIASVPRFGAAESINAVEAAEGAFQHWSALTAAARAALLRRWHDLLLVNIDDLALILTSEQGKPLTEARGEIAYAASFIEFFAEEAKRIYGETIPSPWAGSRIIVTKQAAGVAAAITPWNFPAAMITRKVGAALAAGCTTVVKPAPETPLTALALARLAERAGLPPGVFNVVTGDAPVIGQVFTSHDSVRVLSFTGSTPVGKLLLQQAASTVKKVGLELGGNAAFIVFGDADIDAAVEGAIASKFRNAGQTCVCANRIYVQSGVYDAFVEKLATRIGTIRVGNGVDDGVEQGPLINEKAIEKVQRHIHDATSKGAQIVAGGRRHALGGLYFEPTVLRGVNSDMLMSNEETFGPVAGLTRFETEEEVVRQANATNYGLAAYLYARDLGRVIRVAEKLEAGMVAVNSGLLSTAVAPFGGVKESGLGREGSRLGLEEYLEPKYILLAGLGD